MQAIIEQHIAAVNAFDTDAIADTFADDAMVYDVRREFWGKAAIRAWIAKDITGANVTMKVTEVIERGDETVVRAQYDGTYDKTSLPAVLILTNYFRTEHGKIKTLAIVSLQA
jgi:ketosteroid isomerase-like protein